MKNNIFETLLYVSAFIIAVVSHEYAHGFAAYKLGDPTAKLAGRLTLNPIAHIDPIGLLFMVVFKFGWAKGVPVNPRFFKHRNRDNLVVSSAGIIVNFSIAIISAILARLSIFGYYGGYFLLVLTYVNVMLAVFNLMPFPPLDGSKIVYSFLPNSIESFFVRNEKYFYLVLIGLIFTNLVSKIIGPIIYSIVGFLYGI